MLTIFSCPKPFTGFVNIIQRNAIKSWTLLQPRPEIILIGDEEGIAEVCREFGLRHVPLVQRNERGTPLVSAVFDIGQSLASNPYACYVNADIILLDCFMQAFQRVVKLMGSSHFLSVGRRWGLELSEALDFKDTRWDFKLRDYARSRGSLGLPTGIDYFLFPKGLWKNIPPFALGRCHWDNWLVYSVYSRGIPVIDITQVTTTIHENHDYSHIPGGTEGLKKGIEMRRNWQLQGGYYSRIFNIWDSTHVLEEDLKKTGTLRHLAAQWIRLRYFISVLLVEKLYPYSLPILMIVRGARGIIGYFKSVWQLIKEACAKVRTCKT